MLKFRSMYVDAPADRPTHLLESPTQHITRLGAFLRKTSLDELPQLINILRGDMSFVGPRPALWNQTDLLTERDKYGANDVMPGLTGIAQISGRDELSIEVKARLDGEYVESMSHLTDLKCLLGTLVSVLRSDGIVEGDSEVSPKDASGARATASSPKPSEPLGSVGPMRILVVCQYYYPEQFRITDVCEQLVRDGHSVTVLTGLPNYPMGRIPREYRWGRRRRETLSGVEVLRCFEIGRRSGSVGLILNYASYMVSASLRALTLGTDFDVIFVYQLSPVTMAVPGLVMKKRSGKPLYLYCLDIWPESVKTMVSSESSVAYRIARALSRYVYSRCDRIAVTSKPFIDYLHEEHAIPRARLTYLPGYAEDICLGVDVGPVNDVTDFVFMGNIGIAQDIDCILRATAKIRYVPGFKVHFVGDGARLEASKELARRLGLEEIVSFHGRKPLERMPEYYSLADACLLTLNADSRIGLTMPGKLQGYMAAGKPVIGAINGAAREVVSESGCGVCVDAGDSDGLAAVMRSFVEDPATYADCGRNGREYFERHFSKDQFIQGLENGLSRAAEAAALPS